VPKIHGAAANRADQIEVGPPPTTARHNSVTPSRPGGNAIGYAVASASRGPCISSALVNIMSAGGVTLLGLGAFYQDVYSQTLRATRSAEAAVGGCLLLLLLAGGALFYGYKLCLRHGFPKPWNAARRISLILAALWTTVAIWMLIVQGVRYASGTLNSGLVALVVPLAGLWTVTLLPVPDKA
jgi:hypothetical protein